MIPKVARSGQNKSKRFTLQPRQQTITEAADYYLHDKGGAKTKNRVVFTHTVNLPTDDPEKAVRFMEHTAARAEELKAAAGKKRSGNKREKTVYCYSLSWHPEEKVTKEEMIAAALETMKKLGIDDREALLAAHNDEEHMHLHIIVNRVSPENGLAAKLGNDWLTLSKWSNAYEKRRGKIYCPQREANENERRARKARGQSGFVKYRGEHTADAQRRKLARLAERFERGPALERNISQFHRQQRQALYAEKERRIAHRQTTLRERNRSTWAFMFRQQKAEARELDETRKSRIKGMLYFLKHRQELTSPGGLKWIFEGLIGYHGVEFWEAMNKRHEDDRKRLSVRVGREKREAIAEENELYRTERAALMEGQKAERGTLRDEYQAQAPARPRRERKPRREAAEKEHKEKPMRDEFEERVRKRVRKPGPRKRKRDRDRDGGRERDD